MEAIDRLIGNEAEFPILGKWHFFNHAGVAPIPRRAADAIGAYAMQSAEQAYIDCHWFATIDQLRQNVAKLMNATADEIAFVKNTSEGLALVANGIDWRPGDRIVTTAVEYPANAYPWLDLVERKGIELIRVPEEVREEGVRLVPLDAILRAADAPRTRLVTISHVEFASGQRHDLAAIGKFCRDRGIRLCVDGIQSLGALPVDVRAMNIDYLSADGHKWLLGPEGAGVFYCRQELIEQTHPALIGWLNVQNAHDFDHIEYRLKKDAGRFECGTYNVPGLLGLKASVDVLMEAGGQAVSGQVQLLTDRLAVGLKGQGWVVVSPRERGTEQGAEKGVWSGIVSFVREGLDATATAKRLKGDGIELAVRGGRLRVSPHFYNTVKQMDRLLEALG